ncbi:hypothetical protein [Nocardia yamanashiensis]|uniref:hypothetical protein n=1 Tax=Nocardia yamanashiensis TaxID=209247 RepID=UPI0012FE2442|nr:hypothetical protein [Nocardia yamanashiensis]
MAAARSEPRPGGAMLRVVPAPAPSAMLETVRGQEVTAESMHRLEADAELIAALQAVEFAGPVWETFACELARYALGVLTAWMSTGHIFAVVRSKRIPCTPGVGELERFISDTDFRDEVADAAVSEALRSFRAKCLAGDGWSREGGASVASFFIGGCVIAFVNELNRHRRAQNREAKAVAAVMRHEAGLPTEDRWAPHDPSRQVIDLDVLREYMYRLSPRDRNIVWGKASGLTSKQIAQVYGERSARGVDRRWSALMAQHDWIRRLGDRESQ